MSKYTTGTARKARRTAIRQKAALEAQERRRIHRAITPEQYRERAARARREAKASRKVRREKIGRNRKSTIGRGTEVSRGYTAAPISGL